MPKKIRHKSGAVIYRKTKDEKRLNNLLRTAPRLQERAERAEKEVMSTKRELQELRMLLRAVTAALPKTTRKRFLEHAGSLAAKHGLDHDRD